MNLESWFFVVLETGDRLKEVAYLLAHEGETFRHEDSPIEKRRTLVPQGFRFLVRKRFVKRDEIILCVHDVVSFYLPTF
jgi:hypothetical protein